MMHFMRNLTYLFLSIFGLNLAQADFVEQTIQYSDGKTSYSGVLVYDEDLDENVPGIFMVPNWMGVTSSAIEKAKLIAGDDYVVFVADMYGVNIRPSNASEAGDAAGFVRADRALMRQRAKLGLETFLKQEAPTDTKHIAAIGFCFGGGTVLELGRSGAEIDAIVSFHGDLMSPTLAEDAAATQAHVLVLHGAADPYVPQTDVQAFVDAMLKTDADWQLIQYSGAVHSFTNPAANTAGQSQYDAKVTERAYESMHDLFEELWD